MSWTTKEAIVYCLAHPVMKLIYPSDPNAEKKAFVFRLSPSHEIAIPFERKAQVTCYVPSHSVRGHVFPSHALSEIHADLELKKKYSASDGDSIAGSVRRNAPSLHPAKQPTRLEAKSPEAFVALVAWLLA
jgi:hypothetical protein